VDECQPLPHGGEGAALATEHRALEPHDAPAAAATPAADAPAATALDVVPCQQCLPRHRTLRNSASESYNV